MLQTSVSVFAFKKFINSFTNGHQGRASVFKSYKFKKIVRAVFNKMNKSGTL